MGNSELEITCEGQIRLDEFENRTGFPAKASLDELEMFGGRYFASKPIISKDKEIRTEYVFLDPLGNEQEVYVWKRRNGEGNFIIHLEARTTNKY